MTEMIIVVGGVVVMRFFIKDNTSYFIMSAIWGAVLGTVSGIAKKRDK